MRSQLGLDKRGSAPLSSLSGDLETHPQILARSLQYKDFNQAVEHEAPEVHSLMAEQKSSLFSDYEFIDKSKYKSLHTDQVEELEGIERQTKQHALAKIAYLPAVMLACYLGLLSYYKSRGGYQAELLAGHRAEDEVFTGGTSGPGEA